MEKFYEELKTLRERQDIELTEIQNRTKINLEILEAFERGEFDALPLPYIRLFLRAYVIEIGGDPDEALTQLEHYLSNKKYPEKAEPELRRHLRRIFPIWIQIPCPKNRPWRSAPI